MMNDEPNTNHHNPDTSGTSNGEGSSVLATTSSENIIYTPIDLTEVPTAAEHEPVFYALEDNGIVTFNTDSITVTEDSSLDDTLPLFQKLTFEPSVSHSMDQPEHNNQRERVRKSIVLHRGQILRQLVPVFCNESILDNDLHFLKLPFLMDS